MNLYPVLYAGLLQRLVVSLESSLDLVSLTIWAVNSSTIESEWCLIGEKQYILHYIYAAVKPAQMWSKTSFIEDVRVVLAEYSLYTLTQYINTFDVK